MATSSSVTVPGSAITGSAKAEVLTGTAGNDTFAGTDAAELIIGNGGGEYGVRGYLSAYDAQTGEKAWRFYIVPGDPSKPFEDAAQERRVLLRRAAREVVEGDRLAEEVGGGDEPRGDCAVLQLRHERQPRRGDLIEAVHAREDERARAAEVAQRLGEERRELRVVDADRVPPHAGRVRERPQEVEDRLAPHRPAHGRGMAHRRMEGAREEEADAERAHRARDGLRREREIAAERPQDVRADHQPLAREAVDERPADEADEHPRADLEDKQQGELPSRPP